MTAQPNLGPRGWNGGSMRYGASMGRPSKGVDPKTESERLYREAAEMRERAGRLRRHAEHADADECEAEAQRLQAKAYALANTIQTPIKVSLRKIRLDSGGYDSGGAYWGHGQPLYWAGSDCGTLDRFFRAATRDQAKAEIRKTYPNATFYR